MKTKKPYSHSDSRGRRSSARPEINFTHLAAAVGVTPSYLSKLFKGIGTPSVPLALKLAEEMQIPLDQLLEELASLAACNGKR